MEAGEIRMWYLTNVIGDDERERERFVTQVLATPENWQEERMHLLALRSDIRRQWRAHLDRCEAEKGVTV